MKIKGFEGVPPITVAGIPLTKYLGENNQFYDPTETSEIHKEQQEVQSSLKKIIYRKPRYQQLEDGRHGMVEEYTEEAKFDYLLEKCGKNVSQQFKMKPINKQVKINKLHQFFKVLSARFKISDASKELKARGWGDPSRYCYMLHQAGVLEKIEINGYVAYCKKPGLEESTVLTRLILNDNLVFGYGTKHVAPEFKRQTQERNTPKVEPSELLPRPGLMPGVEFSAPQEDPRFFSLNSSSQNVAKLQDPEDFFSAVASELRNQYAEMKKILPDVDESTFMKLYLEYGKKFMK